MKNKLLLIFSIIFIFSCSYKTDEINYKEQNKRFDYTSIDNFKKSLVEHFNDDLNRFDPENISKTHWVSAIQNLSSEFNI